MLVSIEGAVERERGVVRRTLLGSGQVLGTLDVARFGSVRRGLPLFVMDAFGWRISFSTPDAITRARTLGTGERLLVTYDENNGGECAAITSHSAPDGVLRICRFYELQYEDRRWRAYLNPRGRVSFRLPVCALDEAGMPARQVALVRHPGQMRHRIDQYELLCADGDAEAAAVACFFACYDCYVNYLEYDAAAGMPLVRAWRRPYGPTATRLDSRDFEALCLGEDPAPKAGERDLESRLERLGDGFAVKPGLSHRASVGSRGGGATHDAHDQGSC